MRLLSSITVIWLLFPGSLAFAQGPPPPNVPTTVQLPTFSFFTVQTTVSVPDSGGDYLGGIGRGGDSSVTRGIGPLRNRALASSRGASGMSVNARIIDNHELDEAILAEAAAKQAGAAAGLSSRVKAIANQASSPAPVESVASIRQQNTTATAAKSSEASEYFAKAQRAESEGKSGVAKIYYQMVVRRDAGQLRSQAQSRLAALESGAKAAVAAR